MTASPTVHPADAGHNDAVYRRRVRSWILYDVAESAFATTVLAAVFPVYYATVAGANLPTAATATQYYSFTLSASVLVLAVVSPVLGTFADVTAAKVRMLGAFAVLGITATALLFTVGEGDWLLASILFGVGRLGFGAANVFYDALLPHVARSRDLDRVSAQGYAFGYLGGGILLAFNVVLIFVLPDDLGTRLALLSVALWWGVLSVPLFRHVQEPPASAALGPAETPWSVTRRRLRQTLADLRGAVDLRRYLLAYLVYNDAIGTVISLAAIYASELGIGSVDVVLALLLVQFSGMGFSLLFGRLPYPELRHQPTVTAFIVGMIALLPLVGLVARSALAPEVAGAAPDETVSVDRGSVEATAVAREGLVGAAGLEVAGGAWQEQRVAGAAVGSETDLTGLSTTDDGSLALSFTGQRVEVTYTEQPRGGTIAAWLDGAPATGADGEPVQVSTAAEDVALDASFVVAADEHGEHRLVLEASGGPVTIAAAEVLPPQRRSSLAVIAGLLVGTVLAAAAFALTAGRRLLAPLAAALDTRRGIVLALCAYAMIAVWGFFLDSVVEFWFLALAVGVVQGGSQALSRSLYAVMIPETMSGEFFGFFSILSKFASVLSPLLFVASVAVFSSSRPAVLLLSLFFVAGIGLLRRVDVDRGRALATARDAEVRRSAMA